MNPTEREIVGCLFSDSAALALHETREIENRTVPEEALHLRSLGDYVDYATKQAESFEHKLSVIRSLGGLETNAGRTAYEQIQGCIKRLEEFVLEAVA